MHNVRAYVCINVQACTVYTPIRILIARSISAVVRRRSLLLCSMHARTRCNRVTDRLLLTILVIGTWKETQPCRLYFRLTNGRYIQALKIWHKSVRRKYLSGNFLNFFLTPFCSNIGAVFLFHLPGYTMVKLVFEAVLRNKLHTKLVLARLIPNATTSGMIFFNRWHSVRPDVCKLWSWN